MKADIVSRERRQFVMVTGLAAVAASLPLSAAQPGPAASGSGKLIVSGRLTGAKGQALAGATLDIWHAGGRASATTDADGRFLFETTVGASGPERTVMMICRAKRPCADGDMREQCLVGNEHLYRDDAGVWRATFRVTVA